LVDDITKSSCKVTWEPPETDNGSPVTGYTVERLTGRSSRWVKVNKETVSERQLDVTDLSAGDDYQFRVCAVNAAGPGQPSEASSRFVAKDEFDVPGRPGAPDIKNMTESTAKLEWKAPDTDGGSPITNYIIEMRMAGETRWKQMNKDETVTETSYEVKGIKWDQKCEFRVTAENKVGLGEPSPPSSPTKYGELSTECLLAARVYRNLTNS
jgi:titin